MLANGSLELRLCSASSLRSIAQALCSDTDDSRVCASAGQLLDWMYSRANDTPKDAPIPASPVGIVPDSPNIRSNELPENVAVVARTTAPTSASAAAITNPTRGRKSTCGSISDEPDDLDMKLSKLQGLFSQLQQGQEDLPEGSDHVGGDHLTASPPQAQQKTAPPPAAQAKQVG